MLRSISLPNMWNTFGQEIFIRNLTLQLKIQGFQGGKLSILGSLASIIPSKKVYRYMCPIPNGFRDRAISLYTRATRHVLTRAAKCIDVDGGIFEIVLY
jgi:hypothetical protein